MRDDAGRNLMLERVAHPREPHEMSTLRGGDTLRAKPVRGRSARRGATRRLPGGSAGDGTRSRAGPIRIAEVT
ncbi:hypothetical protein [Nocardia sp. NPDC052316]|uniref:hypothetical protein n=1 Tax=Nocardia sp. NPDC052316 TaxID=3364329 RepID=UPI0037CCBB9F